MRGAIVILAIVALVALLGLVFQPTGAAFVKTSRPAPGSCDPGWYYYPSHLPTEAVAEFICTAANHPAYKGSCCVPE